MAKIIKLTKAQLMEADSTAFGYLDVDNSTPSNVGTKEIGVTGKIDDKEYGDPIPSDKIANTMTVQGYNRYRMYGSNVRPHSIRENDVNNDGVDDFYNHSELDILSNNDDQDNLIKIPKGVDAKLDLLIHSITNLQPKQQAMVLNKLVETMKLDSIPYSWAKELMHKILSRNNIQK